MTQHTTEAVGGGNTDDARVLEEVRGLIADHLEIPLPEVTAETLLLDLPGVDSLKLLQGLLAVEDHFGITLDEDDAPAVRSIAQVAALVAAALNGDQP
ncbi:acyl carrier protein [Streptomyces luteireticuli]|uniref:Carrier domain-containing protein n=1 Tax=Streptomyces luteireticuli TaxID=173858 RepID=A0ABP3IAK3_9ACTN